MSDKELPKMTNRWIDANSKEGRSLTRFFRKIKAIPPKQSKVTR